jgi:probable addiction module antidote protein
LEAEEMMKRYKAGMPYDEWEIKQLRSNPDLGVEYLKVALECLQDPDDRGASLLMLRAIAEAYGGLGAVAAKAGISRESLYRSLSPKGNPTLKTLVAVLNTMGLSLSVVPQQKKARKLGARKTTKAARVRVAA